MKTGNDKIYQVRLWPKNATKIKKHKYSNHLSMTHLANKMIEDALNSPKFKTSMTHLANKMIEDALNSPKFKTSMTHLANKMIEDALNSPKFKTVINPFI